MQTASAARTPPRATARAEEFLFCKRTVSFPITALIIRKKMEKLKCFSLTTAAACDILIKETKKLEGIYYVRVWLNEGELQVGDDIMYVLIGGDIRPRVIDALQSLVGTIKSECVTETELY